MGTQSEEQVAVFHNDGDELDAVRFLSKDQIADFKKTYDLLEVVEHSAEDRYVRAARNIRAGTVIGMFDGAIKAERDRYTVSLGDNIHVLNSTSLVIINHSCSPNLALQWPSPSDCASSVSSLAALAKASPEQVFPVLVAIAPISKGAEVTWNYLSSEWELSCPFDCQSACGDLCVGKVLGSKHLTAVQRTRMAPLMAPHILKRMAACDSDIAIDRLRDGVLRSSYANGKDAPTDVDDYQRNPASVNGDPASTNGVLGGKSGSMTANHF